MTETSEMNDMAHPDVVRELMDNAAEVVAAVKDGDSKTLADLANRQKVLIRTMGEKAPLLASETARASVRELQELVTAAMEIVQGEMARYRGGMQATGNKRKVLRAYGTVTVSNTLSG